VGGGPTATTSPADIVNLMVGRSLTDLYPHKIRSGDAPSRDPALEVYDLAGSTNRLDNATLTLHHGEVVGIFGLVGSGRTELLRCIFGLDAIKSGKVKVGTYTGMRFTPADRWQQKIGLVSEDRKGEGLALNRSIAENLILSYPQAVERNCIMQPRTVHDCARRWIEKLSVKCRDSKQPIGELSGGNQQKVAIARLLHHDVDVLLLDEPTRGIDVGSKRQIYELIDALAAAGKAVLIVSSYLPELLGTCDRIAVMARGRLLPARPVAEITEESVMLQATGSVAMS
jgi:ribose transport system ATP-binding protein